MIFKILVAKHFIAMNIRRFLLFLFIFNFQFIFSQALDLSILTIPDSLKQNANSVIRFDDTNVELVSHKKMIITIRKAVTVLNKLGKNESEITVYYDGNRKIKSLEAFAYDAFGSEIKKISKKDFKDHSAANGMSLFDDNRLVYYKYIPISYPYTIYYEYEIETSNTAFIPRWYPYDSYNQSVQKSTFSLDFPIDFRIQSAEKYFKNFAIEKNSSTGNLSFELNNSKAIKHEDLCPSYLKIIPSVILASNKFHLEGVDGVANTWKEFGKWMFDNLIESRMELPESTKVKIKNLVKDIEDPIQKAKIVYEFVQNKTRYISIQVGIGGWMPMLASDVDRLGYGDCKALTNYTKSLMDEVGVESYYTAVYAYSGGLKRSMENTVVSVQGNHAFLYIPSTEKDFWLECTSQTVPFGYQGTFTDDRDVLVITPEGGIIKHTGVHDDKDNFQRSTANYKMNSDGSLEADIKISSGGIQYRNHYGLEKKPERDIQEHYKSDYWPYINNLAINNFTFNNNKDKIVFKENLNIDAKDYASFSGDRMLFMINPFNRVTSVPKRYRNRKLPLEISRGFIDTDEFEITLPADYAIEAIPENINIKNKFGVYEISIEKLSPTKLKYTRSLYIKKGSYPASDYNEYRNYLKQIAKHDKTKTVLIKN